jgi:Cellulase (glycosyl hydrolase family 5)
MDRTDSIMDALRIFGKRWHRQTHFEIHSFISGTSNTQSPVAGSSVHPPNHSLTSRTWSQLFTVLSLIIILSLAFLAAGCTPQPRSSIPTAQQVTSSGFVTRSGTQLMLSGHPFRFGGANMHWLSLDDSTNYPSQFRVNDGLDAAKEMGLTVIRSHDIGISTGCSNCLEPKLGVFNQTALVHDDYVVKSARDRGLRLIIPLTDNYHYPAGGKHNFTDWRGISDENQFYYNPLVIQDFETYIKTLLNHVNVYTGVAYKNDPTILAWETGNELQPPSSWTQTISTYIKSIDSNHLVMDGKSGHIDPNAADLTKVDIVSNHYYPKNIAQAEDDAKIAQKDGKVFIIGEFDWNDANGGDTLSSFLSTIASDSAIAGDAFWELWSHSDQYGYVNSDKEFTLHYPGDTSSMRSSVQQLRMHAYKMSGLPVPPDSIPGTPVIGVVIRGGSNDVLVWRGTALAASYTIERSTIDVKGPWTVICDKCATDISTPWTDTMTPAGALWYRVIAYNLAGIAGLPSVPYQAGSAGGIIVDNLDDWNKVYAHSSNLSFDSNAQYMHGAPSVVLRTTATNEYIIWHQTRMTSFQAIAYFWPGEPVALHSIYTSSDGRNWMLSHPAICSIGGNWLEYIYTLNGLVGVKYVKILWTNTGSKVWNPALGKVTITE